MCLLGAQYILKLQDIWSKVGHTARELVIVLSVACFLVTIVGNMVKALPLTENVSVHP